jgi:hypothetical protein
MRAKVWGTAVIALAGFLPAIAHAATPSFVVYCMQTEGPKQKDKYGTYYFFLRDGIVKGFACDLPGNPCQIVSQDNTRVVFKTPGEEPDTFTIDLRTGAIQQKSTNGSEWGFACKQIPYKE